MRLSCLRASALFVTLAFGAGAAQAGDEALKAYDRDRMQKLFEQMAAGTLEGMSADDMLATGSVNRMPVRDEQKQGDKAKR